MANCMFNPTDKREIGRESVLQTDGALLTHCSFKVNGSGNTIRIASGARLRNCRIFISENNNTVCIGTNGLFLKTEFYIEDDGNTITVGEQACFCGKMQLAAIDGITIEIGRDCLFSSNIQFRTGDSHSVLDTVTGKRINPSADISIGEHVWVGANVICLKGVCVGNNCIIGSSALLAKGHYDAGCILAGVPIRVCKENITWDYERREYQ